MEAGGQTTAEKEDTTYLEPVSDSLQGPIEGGDNVRSESNKTKKRKVTIGSFPPQEPVKSRKLASWLLQKKEKLAELQLTSFLRLRLFALAFAESQFCG
jgi:hypothetical protein